MIIWTAKIFLLTELSASELPLVYPQHVIVVQKEGIGYQKLKCISLENENPKN